VIARAGTRGRIPAVPPSAAVAQRLARLADDQRAAATAPPGPVLCVAPAGSGKTTTLVARIAWLVDGGVDPSTIAAITFNKRAADELSERLDLALGEIGVPSGRVRVRTFHALGREILKSAGVDVERLVERDALLREILPDATVASRRRLDTAFSRLKLDLRVDPADVAADPNAGPVASVFASYEQTLAERGALDFDDFVARTLKLLDAHPDALATWRARCAHLLVDEAQDLDRSQLDLALVLAAPANRIFLVGDDDQSIYGWRLADVRRVLTLAMVLPGLRRIDLETNYRCPATVVSRAVRLIDRNEERFRKRIVPRPDAPGRVILAGDSRDETERIETLFEQTPEQADTTIAVLARTNRELLPAISVAVAHDRPFRPPAAALLVDDPRVDSLLDEVARDGTPDVPLLVRLQRVRSRAAKVRGAVDVDDGIKEEELLGAMIAWAAPYESLDELRAAVVAIRERVARLARDDATLTLATVHGTKGLEWDHVAVLGMEVGRFPSRRAVADHPEPDRALEEERRLAYVAWTRARRSLTLMYDPEAPSPFLLEAFSAEELGLRDASRAH
jgi:superfamily I DNA/RNA helicase